MKKRKATRNASAEKVWQVLAGLLLLAALVFAFNTGLKRQEKVDCYKWQNYEKNYSLFEASPETVERCSALGVEIKN
jgi:hypothetical protein